MASTCSTCWWRTGAGSTCQAWDFLKQLRLCNARKAWRAQKVSQRNLHLYLQRQSTPTECTRHATQCAFVHFQHEARFVDAVSREVADTWLSKTVWKAWEWYVMMFDLDLGRAERIKEAKDVKDEVPDFHLAPVWGKQLPVDTKIVGIALFFNFSKVFMTGLTLMINGSYKRCFKRPECIVPCFFAWTFHRSA